MRNELCTQISIIKLSFISITGGCITHKSLYEMYIKSMGIRGHNSICDRLKLNRSLADHIHVYISER